MKNLFYFICTLCLFSYCHSSKKKEFSNKKSSFITKFSTDLNTHYDIEKKDSTIQYYFRIISTEPLQKNVFVYILNGECSVCISYLAKFISYLNEANVETPITVITSQKNIQNVKYYMQQFDMTRKRNLSYKEIPENQCYNRLEYYNSTVLYIHKNQIINSFSFFDLINDPNFIIE